MTANGGSRKEKANEPSELDEVDLSKLKLVSSLVALALHTVCSDGFQR